MCERPPATSRANRLPERKAASAEASDRVLPTLPVIAGGIAAAAYLDAKHFIAADLVKARALIDVTVSLKRNNARDRNSIYYIFNDNVAKLKDQECYVCENVRLTWGQADKKANQFAHWLLSRGLKRGDTVALYMPNKPAYVIIFLACLAIDVVPAFINYNLEDDGLRHCVSVAKAQMIIYESTLSASIAGVAEALRQTNPRLQFVNWVDNFSSGGEKAGAVIKDSVTLNLPKALDHMSRDRIPGKQRAGLTWQSPACLIYTSGTTGLPKAAIVTHGRSATAFKMWTRINHFGTKTRIYTPMPLYHSTAMLLAIGAAWNAGATVIIGRKFSASTFWKDVRESNANVIQYVGEVLRYLLALPPSALDKEHNVKLAYGNGCRPDVWNKFRDRFGVDVISEFFASSEGNGSLYNYNGNNFGAGAVGHEGTLAGWARRVKQAIVKVDSLTEEPYRNEKGFCVRTEDDEPGELLCQIDPDSPFMSFAGYYGNDGATEKKIMRDVFSKGDAYFRTGDLLSRSKEGFYYFADRLGDTFRWKSENVSTTAVSEAMGAIVDEANVYGVLVPSHEGRAGCAAIPATPQVDFEKLSVHVQKVLPKYAQPLFIRIVQKMESTGTEKQLKVVLRNEGVDPAKVSDPVYWLSGGKYKPFTKTEWESLQGGKFKL
ncbi:hypothetical protein MVLG_04346 [Microbotryum lychnidis-dioicae p1A1 Lamole]|uniref:Very long-chain fatty acid transport protein n=1 Tax=Microbotryum lychnidis-dioicae (strain p1A1 Lamole / MvSl-1064) TaxID=683840 RepID=U5HAY1_USTV1|nr:hypothetical protein MVLG_04346 [Microbotryum lychnidis-dioicae p1A1 Lamole]|eukprot:KDE05315.1 hypothetical protein MVLG_04346 [Microbotryum lychnidis-dioicae p1A1 Lamole]